MLLLLCSRVGVFALSIAGLCYSLLEGRRIYTRASRSETESKKKIMTTGLPHVSARDCIMPLSPADQIARRIEGLEGEGENPGNRNHQESLNR